MSARLRKTAGQRDRERRLLRDLARDSALFSARSDLLFLLRCTFPSPGGRKSEQALARAIGQPPGDAPRATSNGLNFLLTVWPPFLCAKLLAGRFLHAAAKLKTGFPGNGHKLARLFLQEEEQHQRQPELGQHTSSHPIFAQGNDEPLRGILASTLTCCCATARTGPGMESTHTVRKPQFISKKLEWRC